MRMDEITIGDKTYVSSKQAAKITGYAKDYVGQLCREGRVEARLVGRNWYVLDSAIREHRFGKPEKEAEEAPVTVTNDRSSTWKKPQYEAEIPVLVPDFTREEVSEIGTPAIADMQSAWREWFEDKQTVQAPGSEVFVEETTEIEEIEEIEADEGIRELTEVDTDVLVEEEKVAISRIEYVEEEIEAIPSDEEVQLQKVDINRVHTPSAATPTARASQSLQAASYARAVKNPGDLKEKSMGIAVTRALLVVFAVAVGLVALVGTGHADQYLAGTSLDFGMQKEIIDYLGGKRTYESSFK